MSLKSGSDYEGLIPIQVGIPGIQFQRPSGLLVSPPKSSLQSRQGLAENRPAIYCWGSATADLCPAGKIEFPDKYLNLSLSPARVVSKYLLIHYAP